MLFYWLTIHLFTALSIRAGKVPNKTLYDQLSKCFKVVGIRTSSDPLGQREQKVVSKDQIRRLGELTIKSKAKPMVFRELTGSRYYRQVGGRGDGEMLLVSPVRLAGPKRVLRRKFGEVALITSSSSSSR